MARNYLRILEEIDQILMKNNLEKERVFLEGEIRACSTGGEICDRIWGTLLQFQKNEKINKLIRKQISEFHDSCNQL